MRIVGSDDDFHIFKFKRILKSGIRAGTGLIILVNEKVRDTRLQETWFLA